VDHKGYVTENDLRAWRIMRKASRRLAHPPADKLKPQHAFQRHPDQPPASPEQRAALSNGRLDHDRSMLAHFSCSIMV
ncbi:MAG TPA: hypothetical protein VGM32_15810, partial [Rhodopila sp.]